MSSYRELMWNLRQTHQNFHREWRDWNEGKLGHREKLKLKGREPENVTRARQIFLDAFNNLHNAKIHPLESKLQTAPTSAVDEVIEFLSTDIPAFRCGYAKEVFLTKLKAVELSSKQISKLQKAFLDLCEAQNFHREFRRWCRLIIRTADEDFFRELEKLSRSANRCAVIKSKWTIEMLVHHRKDLAYIFINFPS